MTELETGGISNPHPGWSDSDIKKDASAWQVSGPRKPLPSCDARIRNVKTDDSLASIAAEVKKQLKFDFDGIKLAEFNWDTTVPKEINWYLKHYSGCKQPTSDKYNYMFQTRSPIPEFIWVPVKKKPAGRKTPGTRGTTTTVVQDRCKYRTSSDCSTTSSPCRERPGSVPSQTVEVKNRRRGSVIRSTQEVGQVTLTWTGERISEHTAGPTLKMGDRYTWIVQRLQFDWVSETSAEKKKSAPSDRGLPGNWQAIRRHFDQLAKANLVSIDDIRVVANAVRALVAEGRVKRLLVRGYADREETKHQDAVALSQRRAEFVKDQLVKRYRIDFTGIDVIPIGCGAWYAPAGEHEPSRAVEVEPVLRGRKEAAFEQIVPAWAFHTYSGPHSHTSQVGTQFRLDYFKESGGNVYRGRATSAAEVVLEQARALSYIDAFEEISNEAASITGAATQDAVLEQMRDAVRGWTWEDFDFLPPLFSRRVKSAGGKYTIDDKVQEVLKIVQPDGSIKDTPLSADSVKKLKTVNHTVEELWSVTLSGYMDDQLQRRLHANIHSPPVINASGLIAGFKRALPAPP